MSGNDEEITRTQDKVADNGSLDVATAPVATDAIEVTENSFAIRKVVRKATSLLTKGLDPQRPTSGVISFMTYWYRDLEECSRKSRVTVEQVDRDARYCHSSSESLYPGAELWLTAG